MNKIEFLVQRDMIEKIKPQYIKTESLRAQLVDETGDRLANSGLRLACQIGGEYFHIKHIDGLLRLAESLHEDVIFVRYAGLPESDVIYLQGPIGVFGVGDMEILVPAIGGKERWSAACAIQMIITEMKEK